MILTGLAALAGIAVNAAPNLALRRPPARHARVRVSRHALTRTARAARKAARRGAKRVVLTAYDTETMRLLRDWNRADRLAELLAIAGQMAQAGPRGRRAALILLCEVRDVTTAARLGAELRAYGITYGSPVGLA